MLSELEAIKNNLGTRQQRQGTAAVQLSLKLMTAHVVFNALLLQVHGEDEAAAPIGRRGAERSQRSARLAAAVGVSQMVLPFWSGATWDKQHGVDVERKR